MHSHLRRLAWLRRGTQLFFISTNTNQRRPILTAPKVARILVEEWNMALICHGWKVGRYVVMPDHVHFFCWPDTRKAKTLSQFMQAWKQWTSKRIIRECNGSTPVWQADFFDHLLRSTESAQNKWKYVVLNPVRAGLVVNASDWPWQGEIW
jgi:putative transposase